MYVHARVQSNRLTERKVHSRTRPCVCMEMCAMRACTHHTCTQTHSSSSDKRAATSVDPPGRSLRICRLSPLIWGSPTSGIISSISFILIYCTRFLFFSVTASILQIRSRMIHCERWRKRDVIGVSFRRIKKWSNCCLRCAWNSSFLKCKVKYQKRSNLYKS